MQIVIDMPEMLLKYVETHTVTDSEVDEICDCIKNGTPLSKGHGDLMFSVGDRVYGIDEYLGDKYLVRAMIIAISEKFYICVEQVRKEDESESVKDIFASVYEKYKENGDFYNCNVLMLKDENTFATEEEAREALEVTNETDII